MSTQIDYENRVVVPRTLTIRHRGTYAWGAVTVFGAPGVFVIVGLGAPDGHDDHRHRRRCWPRHRPRLDAAKTLYEAMTRVQPTTQVSGESTHLKKASQDGRIACERWLFQGRDRGYSCTILVETAQLPEGVQTVVGAVDRCDAG